MKETGRLQESVEKYKIENKTLSEYKTLISKEKPATPAPSEVQVKVTFHAAEEANPHFDQSISPPVGVSPQESRAEVVSEPSSPAPLFGPLSFPLTEKLQRGRDRVLKVVKETVPSAIFSQTVRMKWTIILKCHM